MCLILFLIYRYLIFELSYGVVLCPESGQTAHRQSNNRLTNNTKIHLTN
jgi:hypothetical protein